MAGSKRWRRLGGRISGVMIGVSGALMVMFIALDNAGWMLASVFVFFGSCVAFVKIVGPAVGAND